MIHLENEITLLTGVVAALVWILPVVLDFRFRSERWRWLRISVWTIAVLSCMSIFLKPFIMQPGQPKDYAIIGSGAAIDTDSLRKKGYGILSENDYHTSVFNHHIHQLALVEFPLQPWELDQVVFDSLIFIPKKTKGIVDFYIGDPAVVGKKLIFWFKIVSDTKLVLLLSGPGGLLDTASIRAGTSSISLAAIPKAEGNFIYQISGMDQEDTVLHERLPVTVTEASAPSLLIINGNPSFESRFIKNHFTRLGYPLNVRTKISKNLFNEEFINTDRKNLHRLSEELLSKVDLLLIDLAAFAALNETEKNNIRQQVKTGKMGLYFMNAFMENSAQFPAIGSIRKTTQNLPDHGPITSYRISSGDYQPITVAGNIIGYRKQLGIGSIGVCALENMYEIALGGNQELYQHILEALTQSLLPKSPNVPFLDLPKVARVHQKSLFRFYADSEKPELRINGEAIPEIESPLQPQLYEVTYWPVKTGWHTLEILPDTVSRDFYVFDRDEWESMRLTEINTYNKHFAATFEGGGATPRSIFEKHYISNWIFLALFLGAMTFLWIEQRFF